MARPPRPENGSPCCDSQRQLAVIPRTVDRISREQRAWAPLGGTLEVQAKLLRALQEREIERVGGARPIGLDLRIVCATNRPLQKLVQAGLFREDLYWRLKVVPIGVPSLRARREDIPDLAQHFFKRLAATYGKPPPRPSPPGRWRCWGATTGRGTSASSRTSSSGWWWSVTAGD